MNPFYPTIGRAMLARMLGIALAGALVAGIYGILHDQATYSISPEYFTKMKFDQFRAADFGFPKRVFVSEIGFLATWWVGLCSAWFLARIAIPVWPPALALRRIGVGFSIILSTAFAAAVAGYVIGRVDLGMSPYWREVGVVLGVTDLPSFVCVGYIHYGSYIGGVLGLLGAILYLRRLKRREIG